MTKKEEEKNKLTWRLSELPSAGEVAELVDSGVLTVEEARQILIKEEVPRSNEEEIEALKDMVKTLQDTVKELLSRPSTTFVPYTKVIEVQPRHRPYWDNIFMSGSLNGSGSVVSKLTNSNYNGATYTLSSASNNLM